MDVAQTREYQQAQILDAVLGVSNYAIAHASATQTEADRINSHVMAAEFFHGSTTLTVPENLNFSNNYRFRCRSKLTIHKQN